MKNFEMAHAENPTEIILATQRCFVSLLREVIGGLKKESKAPGLTWEQIDYLIDMVAKKQPTIHRAI